MKHGAGVHKLNARQADMTPGQKQQFVFDMVKEEMSSSVYMRKAAWGLLSLLLSLSSSSSLSSGSSTSCSSSCSYSCVFEPAVVLVSGEGCLGAPPRGCLIPTRAGVSFPPHSLLTICPWPLPPWPSFWSPNAPWHIT